MSPIIDEVLAMAICVTEIDSYTPEARISELLASGDLVTQGHISTQAAALLEQARLVYTNRHSSSIHFVLPILDLLHNSLENIMFASEIATFNQIKPVVENSPYMGLRAQLPEMYHIKHFLQLVYC